MKLHYFIFLICLAISGSTDTDAEAKSLFRKQRFINFFELFEKNGINALLRKITNQPEEDKDLSQEKKEKSEQDSNVGETQVTSSIGNLQMADTLENRKLLFPNPLEKGKNVGYPASPYLPYYPGNYGLYSPLPAYAFSPYAHAFPPYYSPFIPPSPFVPPRNEPLQGFPDYPIHKNKPNYWTLRSGLNEEMDRVGSENNNAGPALSSGWSMHNHHEVHKESTSDNAILLETTERTVDNELSTMIAEDINTELNTMKLDLDMTEKPKNPGSTYKKATSKLKKMKDQQNEIGVSKNNSNGDPNIKLNKIKSFNTKSTSTVLNTSKIANDIGSRYSWNPYQNYYRLNPLYVNAVPYYFRQLAPQFNAAQTPTQQSYEDVQRQNFFKRWIKSI